MGSKSDQSRIDVLSYIAKFIQEKNLSPTLAEIGIGTEIKAKSQVSSLRDELAKEGYLEYQPKIPRSIKITAEGEAYLLRIKRGAVEPSSEAEELKFISPLVYPRQPTRQGFYINEAANISADTPREQITIPVFGRTVAGDLVMIPSTDFSLVDPECALTIYKDSLPYNIKVEELFALEVHGFSMITSLINDGDYIILRHTDIANRGDMVVVWLDDTNETTLKYFYPEKTPQGEKYYRLVPTNAFHKTIIIDGNRKLRIIGQVIRVVRPL